MYACWNVLQWLAHLGLTPQDPGSNPNEEHLFLEKICYLLLSWFNLFRNTNVTKFFILFKCNNLYNSVDTRHSLLEVDIMFSHSLGCFAFLARMCIINWMVGESLYFLYAMSRPNGDYVSRRPMKYRSISRRFVIVNSSDTNLCHWNMGVILLSFGLHWCWLRCRATLVLRSLRMPSLWLLNRCRMDRLVCPIYCMSQEAHSTM